MPAEGDTVVPAKRGFLSFGRAPGSYNFAGALFGLSTGNFTEAVGQHKIPPVAADEGQQTEEQVALRIIPGRMEGVPRGYANNVRVTFTAEDFTLFFGWYALPPLDERPESGEVTVEVQPVMQISLPLNLMRSVIAVMQRQLDSYEQNFEPIPIHPARPPWMVADEEETRADA